LAFYSNATSDIEYKFPFAWGELWGIADRTDYDLKQHMEFSKEDLSYFNPINNEKFIPYVIEPSVGVERLLLAFLCEAYDEETIDEKDTRVVMRFSNALAPIKAAVLPLSKKLSTEASDVFDLISKKYRCEYDETGSIGKRYRRQDEIGTPYCITYDFDSLDDKCVTIRYRDTMKQERIAINELLSFLDKNLNY